MSRIKGLFGVMNGNLQLNRIKDTNSKTPELYSELNTLYILHVNFLTS